MCHEAAHQFKAGNVYAMRSANDYLRLSPFVVLMEPDDYYIFRNVSERMLGRAEYNQVLRTGTINITWPDFTVDLANDGGRRMSVNGTIINVYKKNYDQYVNVGTTTAIIKRFILRNRSSVCATIWGHGGVGKTAMVQNVCEHCRYRTIVQSTTSYSRLPKTGRIVTKRERLLHRRADRFLS